MEDLARLSRPIGPPLHIPEVGDPAPFRLTGEQVAFFHEHGYLHGVRVLDERQVEVLRTELARLMDPGHPRHALFHEYHRNESTDPSQVLFHALGGWRIEPGFHDLLWHPAVTVPASQLLGGAVRFWHDQLFCKPARDGQPAANDSSVTVGGVVAWHQDYSYWTRTRPMAHLTCWIGLDDAGLDNGCLHHVPGSQRWDLLPITGLAGDMDAIQTVLDGDQRRQFQPVPAVLKAGEASFHHPLTVHGSFANRSDRPRRAVVLNLCRDGVASAVDEPLLEGVPPVPAGQPLGGAFFPLLYDPALRSGGPGTLAEV